MALQIGVVVLAAGLSRRMGQNKLLMDVQGEPMIVRTIQAAKRAHLTELIAVCSDARVAQLVEDCGVGVLPNNEPEKGQSESVRRGTIHLKNMDGILFLPGDQPLIRTETLVGMARLFCREPQHIVCASLHGKRMSPNIIPKRLYEEICRLHGDVGGRQLFLRHGAEILNYPITDAREMLDVDTIADYRKI